MSIYNGVIYDVFGQSDGGPCSGLIYNTGVGWTNTAVETQSGARAAHAKCRETIDGLDFDWVRTRFEGRPITELQSLARSLRSNHRIAGILLDIIAEKRQARRNAREKARPSSV